MGTMDEKIQKNGSWKRAAVAAVGFGIGGIFWGLEAYRGTVGAGESFTNPFSYILGAVALGVFGGLALAYVTKAKGVSFGWKTCFGCLSGTHTIKIIGLGLVGWFVAFALPAVWLEWWFLWGSILLPFLLAIFTIPLGVVGLDEIINPGLAPSLFVGNLWLEFLIAGGIIGLVYSLILKTKITRAVLWSAGGFALASLIGPILGNLIGGVVNSLLASYILTFVIICVIFGVCLTMGIRREQAGTSGAT